MLTIKEWMELADYRITEGADYQWQSYGPNAYIMTSWNGEQDGYSFSIYFDTKTQVVYEVQAHDYKNERAYRIINPDFAEANAGEADERDIDNNIAWDDLAYVDLEVDDDFIQKCLAIKAGEDYDTRVSVPLDLPDDVLFDLMKLAHSQDITLNELVEGILEDAIKART
jgi:hypothetical protein